MKIMEEFLLKIGVGQRKPNDRFFDDSNNTCKTFVRKGITIVDNEELCHKLMKEFSCSVPGCNTTFNTLLDYETHYNGSHRYICATCKTSRPSSRLLDIHIQENHDSFFEVLAKRQPMYQCYVSECKLKFLTPVERREHCIAVHKYPKNFRFDSTTRFKAKRESQISMEVDQRPALIRIEKKAVPRLDKNQKCRTFHSTNKQSRCENVATVASKDSDTVTTVNRNTSSLAFVPRQVTSYSKLLSKRGESHKDVLNNECMMELADSLPD